MSKKMICTLAAVLIVSSTAAFGAIKEGSFSVTPLVGGYVFDHTPVLDPELVLGLRAGYNFNKNLGVEALYDYGIRKNYNFGQSTNISLQRFGGHVLYNFFPDNIFVPYLAAGFTGLKFEGTGFDKKTHGAIDYGVGAKFFLNDDVAIRGDISFINYTYNSVNFNELEYTLGAYFQFGAVEPTMKAVVVAPAPLSEPVKVVEAPVSVPEPVKIVVQPVPAPVPVPEPVKAEVVPASAVVPPADSDNDGVPDYLDKCPGTPIGIRVDSNGCPLDTDKDGVPDYLDKCPHTLVGVVVDTNGCPMEAAKKFCEKTVVLAILFDTNKINIKAKFFDELDSLGNFFKEFPRAKGVIKGHTDSVGGKAANLKLSQGRAESVRKYIISKFRIDGSRISTKGYGDEKPVASNKTAAGKAKNRRIETAITCE